MIKTFITFERGTNMNLLKSIDNLELFSYLQKTSLVNIKFSGVENYIAVAVLYSNQNMLDILIDLKKIKYIIEYGEEVKIKFMKDGYEFLLDGEITEVSFEEPVTATIKLTKGNRYLNKRRYIRYDTDEKGTAICGNDKKISCTIQNLSLGGALVYSKNNISNESEIALRSGLFNEITIAANIVRAIRDKNDGYYYGVEFTNVNNQTEMMLRKILLKLEKEYLLNMKNFKQVRGNGNSLTSGIAVFDIKSHESLDVKEVLGNLGIIGYTLFHDFKVYTDYFTEENPKLAIIDCDALTEEILTELNNISTIFPGTNIIVVMPMQNFDVKLSSILEDSKIGLIYKPFIYNELEDDIKKRI